jgi:hypothetical protein
MKLINRKLLAAAFLGTALAVGGAGCAGFTDKTLVENVDDAAMDIKVQSYKGDVQLSGVAKNPDEARRAEEIVRGLKDVRSVKNDIRLVRN